MLTTVFLRLVDQGVLSLDDHVAKWFPQFPRADKVTLRMLASSTSGYADFVTSKEFNTRFEADPFQFWTPEEVLDIVRKLPKVFPPGTSWAFSDTNFVLLGHVIVKATGRSYEDLLQSNVLDRLGMDDTTYTTTTAIPEPTLHAYSNERGVYEETTYWSPTWATYAATATSTLDDMARFSQALGTGSLLSKGSHELPGRARERGSRSAHAEPLLQHGRGPHERLDGREPADRRLYRGHQLLPGEEGGGRRVRLLPAGWRHFRALRGHGLQPVGRDHRPGEPAGPQRVPEGRLLSIFRSMVGLLMMLSTPPVGTR